jgi:nucleotide-binding universal stress UspA family protein
MRSDSSMSDRHINRILVATDGSDSSQRAVALGVELAAAEQAEVTFLHVAPPVEFRAGRSVAMRAVPRRLRTIGDEVLDEAVVVASDHGVRFQRELIAGETGDTIVLLADAIGADLIVVGERPRRMRVGTSVSRWVMRHSRRPVLVARPPLGAPVAA